MTTSRVEQTKVLLLTACFFCIISCYTILRELRDSLFVHIVGCDYIQHVQIFLLVMLVPALIIYAALVDRFKKHQLLYIYTSVYSIGCLIIGYMLGHATIGLPNISIDYNRWFGWIVYLFIEGYAPFVVSLFFAFLNSITPPRSASRSYSIIIAGSKIGGILTAVFSWLFLRSCIFTEAVTHQYLFWFAGLILMCVTPLIAYLMKKIPVSSMHGYFASYVLEKKHATHDGVFAGLRYLMSIPYVLGMLGLVFFWEFISVILNYHQICFLHSIYPSAATLSGFLFFQGFWIHAIGFVISLCGVHLVNKRIHTALVAVPLVTMLLSLVYFLSDITSVLVSSYILIRSLNFSFSISVREILYIPTSKEIRFKSKSWIDAFGAKCARGAGSLLTVMMNRFCGSVSIYLCLTLIVGLLWSITAYALGRRCQKAISKGEVIGS